MDLKAIAQAQLARIIAAHPGAVVTVVNGKKSASCVRDTRTGEAELDDNGEVGITHGTVRGNADTLGAVTNGQTITVDDSPATVMAHRTDSMGALITIEYQLQKLI